MQENRTGILMEKNKTEWKKKNRFQLADELNLLLSENTFQKEEEQAQILVRRIAVGKIRDQKWDEEYIRYCSLPYSLAEQRFSGKQPTDSELLESILEHSDDETLLALEREYGGDSRIHQLIEKSRRKKLILRGNLEMNLSEELKKNYPSFYQVLADFIQKKGFQSDADFYRSILFSRQLFSKLRDPMYHIGKEYVLWLAAGLELSYLDACQLLAAAGYAFRMQEKRDHIIAYVMQQGSYDLDMLNGLLDLFGEKPIGFSE